MLRRGGSARRLGLASVMAILAGCTVLAPQPDTTRYFLLSPAPAGNFPGVPNINRDRQLALGIGPIGFPDYLKRLEVVSRAGGDRLELSPQDRWAEPLDVNFTSVLAQDLSRILHTQRVVQFPWFGEPHLDYRIEVQVQRFDAGPDNLAHLAADWTIKNGTSGATLYSYRTEAVSPLGTGDAGLPAALSLDLQTLSEQIAAAIVSVNQESTSSNQTD
jgi:uncharacterized protein